MGRHAQALRWIRDEILNLQATRERENPSPNREPTLKGTAGKGSGYESR